MSSELTPNLGLHKWVPTDYVQMGEFNDNFDIIDKQVAANEANTNILIKTTTNIMSKGATTDPEAPPSVNDKAIQDAINSMPSGGTVLIPDGDFNFSEVNIVESNIRMTGYGTMKNGRIIIGDDTTPKILNYIIEGLKFKGVKDAFNGNAIEIQNARSGRIRDCDFRDFDNAIYIRPIAGVQHTNRLKISGNDFHRMNYCVYVDRDPSFSADSYYTVGDIHFMDNQADDWIRMGHFYGKGIDGLVMIGNTLFFPNYADKSTTKMNNVYIDYGNFINIQGNNLFEAGISGVVLRRVNSFNVSDNNIPWVGQRQPSAAIDINVGDIFGGKTEMNGTISNNNIDGVSYVGVNIDGFSGNIKVSDNIITRIGDPRFYYGTTDISAYSKWGVRTGVDTSDISVEGNISPNGEFSLAGTNTYFSDNIDKNGNRIRSVNTQTISSGVTSLNPNGVDQFNLNSSTNHTINSINSTFSGHEITLLAFNGNTTLQNSSTIVLKGGVSTTVPNTGLIKLRFTTGKWYEVSRNF